MLERKKKTIPYFRFFLTSIFLSLHLVFLPFLPLIALSLSLSFLQFFWSSLCAHHKLDQLEKKGRMGLQISIREMTRQLFWKKQTNGDLSLYRSFFPSSHFLKWEKYKNAFSPKTQPWQRKSDDDSRNENERIPAGKIDKTSLAGFSVLFFLLLDEKKEEEAFVYMVK